MWEARQAKTRASDVVQWACSGDEICCSGQCGRFETGQSNGTVSDDSVVLISREGGWTAKDEAKPVLGREQLTLCHTVGNSRHPSRKSRNSGDFMHSAHCVRLCSPDNGHLRHRRAQITSHNSTPGPWSEVCLAPTQAQDLDNHHSHQGSAG